MRRYVVWGGIKRNEEVCEGMRTLKKLRKEK